MLIDQNVWHTNRPVVLKPTIFFGQLQNIFMVGLKASPALKLNQKKKKPYSGCNLHVFQPANQRQECSTTLRIQEGHLKVVNIGCVQCLVGL